MEIFFRDCYQIIQTMPVLSTRVSAIICHQVDIVGETLRTLGIHPKEIQFRRELHQTKCNHLIIKKVS
jgi:hypothetical protein